MWAIMVVAADYASSPGWAASDSDGPGPVTLGGWIDQRGGIAGAFAALLSHPRLPEAAHAFVANTRAAAAGDKALDRILKDVGGYIVTMCVLYLHLTGGATLPRLKAMNAPLDYLSPGRARSMLGLMRHFGYLEAVPSDIRGDPARYIPTARFLSAWEIHLRALLDATRIVEPSVARVLDCLHEPEVFGIFCRHHTEQGFMEVREGHQDTTFVRVFLHRFAGLQILWDLSSGESGDDFPQRQPVHISLNAIARRHGVSRSHVKRLLDAGARGGYLRYAAVGEIVLEEPGAAAVRFFQATQFFVFIAAAERTAAEMAVRPGAAGRTSPAIPQAS
jgi:hypothetical protein